MQGEGGHGVAVLACCICRSGKKGQRGRPWKAGVEIGNAREGEGACQRRKRGEYQWKTSSSVSHVWRYQQKCIAGGHPLKAAGHPLNSVQGSDEGKCDVLAVAVPVAVHVAVGWLWMCWRVKYDGLAVAVPVVRQQGNGGPSPQPQ